MKTIYDAVTEAKLNESRFKERRTTQVGKRVTLGKCFICGQRCGSKVDICQECEDDFPSIKNKNDSQKHL